MDAYRRSRIEDMLREEFEDAGCHVFQVCGDWFASVRDPETIWHSSAVNITRLAEQIAEKLP